ncbi:MAG: TlpA disulfide reductase family protein [Melioribacter sp.]|uniref:TlpA family protein disulfide reductase n=1 Tax=Rosettibacter primus TaxID=3111523 RepID=UPI00247BF88C|nr:TlpA disulfide reductase family protein [Melioribacter sp.]
MKKFFVLLFFVFIFTGFKLTHNNDVIVEKIDKYKLQKLIKDRKGKLLFLNIWATWCEPCREEFPAIVKLSNEFKDVDFVGISVDFPEEIESKIKPFIKNNKVNFPVYVNSFSNDEELINMLNKDWNGAIPATFIFDKSGKLISFIEGKKSYEEFEKNIKRARRK